MPPGEFDLQEHGADPRGAASLTDGADQIIGARRPADRATDLHDCDPSAVGEAGELFREPALRDHHCMLVGLNRPAARRSVLAGAPCGFGLAKRGADGLAGHGHDHPDGVAVIPTTERQRGERNGAGRG